MSKLQTEECKHCGYQEFDLLLGGNTLAQYCTVEKISREPIKTFKCIECGKDMQLYYQEHHRRFYKCWSCGNQDADSIYYESEQHKGTGF